MPTITFSLTDLGNLVGKKITLKEMEELANVAKGELEGNEGDEVTVSLDDTNLPYLWSVEGLARLYRGYFGMHKGLVKLALKKSAYDIQVDASVADVRPYITAFVFKGPALSEYALKQLIQLQEKFCDGYGRKRQKVSIGLYSYKRIAWPVHYTTTLPHESAFVPLEGEKAMTPKQILEEQPKGKEYGWILDGQKRYPILKDDNGEVLSLPPIINSNLTGKIEVGDTDVLFEATGSDEEALRLATSIFAQAISERGYAIHEVAVHYGRKKVMTPELVHEKVKISPDDVERMLGLGLKESEVRDLLERAGFGFSNWTVTVPHYRADIMHKVDVIEDIAIMKGFSNIAPAALSDYTVGGVTPLVPFIDALRELLIGCGYQEVMSPILSNRGLLYEQMRAKDLGTVEIEQYMSETYSVVRTWLLPVLMELLSRNKHVDYPQRVFEQGLVTRQDGRSITDSEKIAAVCAYSGATFSEMKQVLEAVGRGLGIAFAIKHTTHQSFIPGRVGEIVAGKQVVGIIGEVAPQVLANFRIEVPVAAFEIDCEKLKEA